MDADINNDMREFVSRMKTEPNRMNSAMIGAIIPGFEIPNARFRVRNLTERLLFQRPIRLQDSMPQAPYLFPR